MLAGQATKRRTRCEGRGRCGERTGNRAAARAQGRRRGLTMVELLIVLAIIALMTAVAIPTFSRLGFFSGNEMQDCARELYAMLRAAKIYAATYRVDAAVAYNISLKLDALTSRYVEHVGAVAMVYKLPVPVKDLINAGYAGDMYVPVEGSYMGARFHELPEGTGLLANGVLSSGGSPVLPGDTLQAIQIFSVGLDGLTGREVPRLISPAGLYVGPGGLEIRTPDGVEILEPVADWLDYLHARKCLDYEPANTDVAPDPDAFSKNDFCFPAHVFTPSGQIRAGGSERFKIWAGFTPDTELREQFVDPTNPIVDPENPEGKRAIPIELYRSTARVKIASD